MKVLQLVDAGNRCVSGSSIDRTFFSLFPEFEDLVGNLVVKVLQEVNQHKLTIQLRLLKIINDTASLNNSSVVSNVYTPTIPHLNTYAASRHSGIPIHHVPIISIIIMVFCVAATSYNASAKDHIFHLDRSIQGKYDEQRLSKLFYAVINTI